MESNQLGYVDNWKCPRTSAPTPYDSILGGVPGFYEDHAIPAQPRCATCGNPLFLVLQIYSPTDRDRTLYILGCNSVRCNLVVDKKQLCGDWKVLRCQRQLLFSPVAVPSPAPPPAPTALVATDEWGASSDWSDTVSGWDLHVSAAPAPAATQAHAAVAAESPASDSTVAVRTQALPAVSSWSPLPGHFEAYDLTVYEEDDHIGSSDSSDDDRPTAAKKRSKDVAHAADLFERYKALEVSEATAEAEALVAMPASSDSDVDEDDEPALEEHAKDARRRALRRVPGGDRRKGGATPSAAAADDGAEKYEQLPPKFRYMMKYQNFLRDNQYPCVRYAYGRKPLWPVAPSLRPSRKPARCPCGADRVFELQIFSTALAGLDVDTHAVPSPASATLESASTFHAGGMDFLTVLVFSCPLSCDLSAEECCVVITQQD